MTTKRDIEVVREMLIRNVAGLISPANSGMAIAIALFELADAQREHTDQMRRLVAEWLARGATP